MMFVAVTLITLSGYGFRTVLLDTAAVVARDTGQIVAERIHRMLGPGTASLRMLTFDPITDASRLEDRLARRGVLMTELADNPLVSAILVGYENGDYVRVSPLDRRDIRQSVQAPPQADYMVQTVTHGPDGTRTADAFFYDDGHELVLHRAEPGYLIDPRQRPWYAKAIDTVSPVTSGPYVFFSTGEVGITLSRLAQGGRAVVALDVTLKDLGTRLDELRMTPSAELALVDAQGAVVGYHDMDAVLVRQPGSGELGVRTLETLAIEPLSRLLGVAEEGKAVPYHAAGREWFGIVQPIDGIAGMDLRLLMTAPTGELLGDLERFRTRMVLISIALILLCFPLGWQVGSAVGQALERLTAQAKPMSHFDFRRSKAPAPSRLSEIDALNWVMDNVAGAVEAFLSISRVLGAEPRIETMLTQVLEHLVSATRSLGGAVYLRHPGGDALTRVAAVGDQETLPELRQASADPARESARGSRDDARHTEFELRGRRGTLEGVLVLAHLPDQEHTAPEFLAFTNRLTGMLAVAIETRQLIEAQQNLLEAMIRILADAIDAKSPYTGGHCERVPRLATMLVDRMAAENSGPYAGFHLDEDGRYAFYLGSWLHDCGKVTSPEHIVDKATKLEVIYNRIHEIRMRFEVLWRDADIDYLQARLAGQDEQAAAARRDARRAELLDDFRFVAASNIGGEFLPDAAIERLHRIGAQTWQRHFDDSLGLSAQESSRLAQSRPMPPELPASEQLLADKPEHRVQWEEARRPPVERGDPRNVHGFDMTLPAHRQHMGELHNLAIRRGTLTDEDRFAVNDHIVQTLIMLKGMPWPQHLARVPDIAANHHEKMDGTGYPRRLRGEDLPVTERVMALVDVFEALTAADRPYKPPKTLSESLGIMAAMCRGRHLDTELYQYFLRSRVWLDYARQFIDPGQIDDVDIEALARAAQPEPAS
ncbi:HD domain-containing phosphohydrolase [Pigmentiphaga humi]|nr:HD domain-containing phosphohydrolase [Pigmentiphaga humi]